MLHGILVPGLFVLAPRCPTNWKQGQRLGSGAFGEVYLCFDHDTGRELAVKMVKLHGVNAEVSKVQASVIMSVLIIYFVKQIDYS